MIASNFGKSHKGIYVEIQPNDCGQGVGKKRKGRRMPGWFPMEWNGVFTATPSQSAFFLASGKGPCKAHCASGACGGRCRVGGGGGGELDCPLHLVSETLYHAMDVFDSSSLGDLNNKRKRENGSFGAKEEHTLTDCNYISFGIKEKWKSFSWLLCSKVQGYSKPGQPKVPQKHVPGLLVFHHLFA